MKIGRNTMLALCLPVAVVACTSPDYALPDLLLFEPAVLEAGESKQVLVRGTNFQTILQSNVESGETIVNRDFRVLLFHSSNSIHPIELQAVEYVDDESLLATVPSSVPSGTFAALVMGPTGQSLKQEDAFTVKRLSEATFNEPQVVPGVSSQNFDDDDPTLTADLLEIYFKSTRGAGLGIYASTRASASDPWSRPARVAELNAGPVDDTPDISSDGLTIYFSSNRDGMVDLYQSTRVSRTMPWSTPTRIEELSSEVQDYSATTDSTGLTLVMNRAVDGNQELFQASRNSTNALWSIPTPIVEVNTERYEADAVLDPSGLRLLYTLEEAMPENKRQIYRVERDSLQSPFGSSTALEAVNSVENDEDPWISPDLGVIYFSRTVGGRKDIYMATRETF